MKKIILFLLTATLIFTSVSFVLSADGHRTQKITVGKNAPTVDGEINPEEGWSAPAYMNTTTASTCWSTAPQTTVGNIYFAYTEDGLYYAADLVENVYGEMINGLPVKDVNSFIYSTGRDNIDNDHGYNGDVFILTFDIERAFYNAGYNRSNSYSPWYCVGLFEEEGAKMCREMVRDHNDDITDLVEVEGTVTDRGWRFEAFIPWDIIVEDASLAARRNPVTYDREMLSKGDFMMYTHAIYHDRFLDEEVGDVDTWSRYATVADFLPDGNPGTYSSGVNIPCYGLHLNMSNHTLTSALTKAPSSDYDAGNIEVSCTECNEKITEYYAPVENSTGEYDDVKADMWYSEAIRYCGRLGYMNGIAYRLFDADYVLTREQFVTILYNISGTPDNPDCGFNDVDRGAWYTQAINWAKASKVVSGISEDMFGVGNAISRQELATMLYNFCVYRNFVMTEDGSIDSYADKDRVAVWARTAMEWAVETGLISGTSETTLSPEKTGQRMEAAAIIERFAKAVRDRVIVEKPRPMPVSIPRNRA